MSRTFGWIQDSGSFENLKRVLQAITPNSTLNSELRERLITAYVPERYGRDNLLSAIETENCNAIPYDLLKGFGSARQLTVEENISMFGYSETEAERIVARGGRGNAACSGIAQLAIPAQKLLPDGRKKPYQGDWQAECFLRWAVSLGFMDYDPLMDSCKVSQLGSRFVSELNGSDAEKEIIGEALLSYPPACRVLELLAEQGHLTKFEIGRQLGFLGEAGFTSLSQALYVGGFCTASDSREKSQIRQNYEGSSDKYARMIAGWLVKIGWVKKVRKEVSESYLGEIYTANIDQSYMITQRGQTKLNRIRGGSRHSRSSKRVFWSMLATAAPDADYLRNRRYHLVRSIMRQRKTRAEIVEYLRGRGFDAGDAVVEDELKNLVCIGLNIDVNNRGYLLKDTIIGLEIPTQAVTVRRENLTDLKDWLRERLANVDHRYIVLVDLAFCSEANREFEIETMSLFTDALNFNGLHLGGGRQPDGLFYLGRDGVIVDTKAYSRGYNLPIQQADEMIRYIEENKSRGDINPNCWWRHFSSEVSSFSYLFVSSIFTGQFREKIDYIRNRTDYDGGAIAVKNLLLYAESILSGATGHDEAFQKLRVNDEIVME